MDVPVRSVEIWKMIRTYLRIVSTCATQRCNLVFSLSESIKFSVNFLRDVLVSSAWEFFGGGILNSS